MRKIETHSRTVALLCLLVLGVATVTYSYETPTASAQSKNDWRASVLAEIKEQHRQEQQAFVKGNCDAVVSFFDDKVTIYRGGRRVDLPETLAFCKKLPRPFAREGKRPEINDDFYVLSENAAHFVRTIDFEPADEESSTFKREVVTKVWSKTNDGWKIVHFHSSTHMVSND